MFGLAKSHRSGAVVAGLGAGKLARFSCAGVLKLLLLLPGRTDVVDQASAASHCKTKRHVW